MDIKIKTEEGNVFLYTPYNPEFVSAIKRIGKARWNGSRGAWSVPRDYLDEARAIIKSIYGYDDEEPAKMLKGRLIFLRAFILLPLENPSEQVVTGK